VEDRKFLVVGAFDPTGGAGLSLSMALSEQCGYPAFGCVTALTDQDYREFRGIRSIPKDWIERQLRAVVGPLSGVKIGALGSQAAFALVSEFFERPEFKDLLVVVDPVLQSTTGGSLLGGDLSAYIDLVLSRADLITPNRREAAALTRSPEEAPLDELGERLLALGVEAVVITDSEHQTDWLILPDKKPEAVRYRHPISWPCHGTGCLMATMMMILLAERLPLRTALLQAQERVAVAMEHGLAIQSPGQRRLRLGRY